MSAYELRLYRYIGGRLPAVPHATAIVNRILGPIYLRKHRSPIQVDVLGVKMELNPHEAVDRNLLFCPQLYDPLEIGFMLKVLGAEDVFVDVGSHIGFYSLMASKKIARGSIVAIEADPFTFKRLEKNVELNGINVTLVNKGVGDKREDLVLNVQDSGNRGGSSFISGIESNQTITVHCYPLLDILNECGIEKITCMKLDIEGFEFKVLKHFFENAESKLFPKYIISEFVNEAETSGSQLELLEANGYSVVAKSVYNLILERG